MSDKHVDDLLMAHQEKQRELQAIGQELRQSAHSAIVCFVDLAESTALKTKLEADEWLGYIYRFLATVDGHARTAGGTVVKRIGDELLLSFLDTNSSERFLVQLETDPSLPRGSFKAAIDCGEAYYLRFAKGLEDDPYGTVVDRCARMAKLAGPGAIVCSADYRRAAPGGPYAMAGRFSIKGLPKPEELFLRQPPIPGGDYLKPLLDSMNASSGKIESYTSLPRYFDETYLSSLGRSEARPFIARALLNVPRLPDTPGTLEQRLTGPNGDHESNRLRGYYIDWLVTFEKYDVKPNELQVTAKIIENRMFNKVWIALVPSMVEVVRGFSAGQRLRLRGILMEVFITTFRVNYADFEVV